MEMSQAFAIEFRPSVAPGKVRLTRLNIYSAVYVEFSQTRILVDPSYVLAEIASELRPNVILVSHESLDHFDARLCLKLLASPKTTLIGSWGVVISLADHLAADDLLWRRIYVGIPGAVFELGDLVIKIEEAQHCEYASPIFFDIQDGQTDFRILDAVDTEVTPRMERGEIPKAPDVLIVPLGIALAASPSEAWRMIELLQPRAVFANHYTKEASEFRDLIRAPYEENEGLIVLDWYEGVTLAGANPVFRPEPIIWMADEVYPGLAQVLPGWIYNLPSREGIMREKIVVKSLDARSLSTVLYFMAWAALRGHATPQSIDFLKDLRDWLMSCRNEQLLAAYLLAFGATAGGVSGVELSTDIESFKTLLSIESPYIDYWVLESWGRAGMNPALGETVIRLFEEISASNLDNVVAVRRKLSWEVHRLVRAGYVWPSLKVFLNKGHADRNPDVRLLTYKTLVYCYSAIPSGPTLLSTGLADEHQDVLEWALRAHICLFDVLEPASRSELAERLPALLEDPNYHIRSKASVLAELCGGIRQ